MRLQDFICCFLLLIHLSCAGAELRLAGNESSIPLTPFAELFEDGSATENVADVAAGSKFAHESSLLHPGHTRSAIWIKLDLVNDASTQLTRWITVEPSTLDEVSLFIQQDGNWQRLDAGIGRSFQQWPIPSAFATFPVRLEPGVQQTIYLRVASRSPIAIIPTLWEPRAFREAENKTRLVDGIMLGILGAMPLFGILLFFMFRDAAFLFNVLAATTFFLGESSAKGYSFMFLWPTSTGWATLCLSLFATLGVCWNVLFLRALLDTRRKFPEMDRMLLWLLCIQFMPVLGILLGDYWFWAKAANVLHLLATLVFIAAGVSATLGGIRAARFYTVAFLILATGGLLHLCALSGLIPPVEANKYILPLTMMLHNVTMLASVVDRIMLARKERELAQRELLSIRAAQQASLEKAVKERTADLNTALARLREANRSQSRLVAHISHDLRAPLATIVNFAHLLKRHDTPEVQRYLGTIEQSAAFQLQLIDELVEYARGAFGNLELISVPTYVHGWLTHIAGHAELLASQGCNHFHLHTEGDIPPILVFDPKRLQQVLLNLLSNAAKFTSCGKIILHITASQATGGKVALAFRVDDTGCGIAAENLDRIFQPFERCNSEKEGSGLGLSITRHLVTAIGGELKAESTVNKGSSFGFCLLFDVANESAVQQPVHLLASVEDFGTGKSVLIVEDTSVTCEYLREVLFMADFDVTCAQSGNEALMIASEQKFDIMLFDQSLPDMTAWELLRAIRQTYPAELPPVILCSAMPAQPPNEYSNETDFARILLKPVAACDLLQIMKELLHADARQQTA